MSIRHDTFELIRTKYGHNASWAIWAEEGGRPKHNVGDLSIFDIRTNPSLLSTLNPHIVFVALNISRPIETPLSNFHDASPHAMDFKIRYALRQSRYWGAYMTDIIKDYEEKASEAVMNSLKAKKKIEEENIATFRKELDDIGSKTPELIAFGRDAFSILKRHFAKDFEIRGIPHYSHRLSKEEYREQVKAALDFT